MILILRSRDWPYHSRPIGNLYNSSLKRGMHSFDTRIEFRVKLSITEHRERIELFHKATVTSISPSYYSYRILNNGVFILQSKYCLIFDL